MDVLKMTWGNVPNAQFKTCSLLVLSIVAFMLGLSAGESHSLRYFYTGVSGALEFPKFMAVGYVDDETIGKYDISSQRFVPLAQWLVENEDQNYWDRESQNCQGAQYAFNQNMKIVMLRTNQTSGIHSLQLMYGCYLHDDGTTSGFSQFGYDGHDYITFVKETMTWTATAPSASITKDRWDRDAAYSMQTKVYLEQTCIEWLQKYIKYGQTSRERKVPPEAKMTDKTESGSTKLKCKVSGFYPQYINVTFVKGDNDKVEATTSTGVLPNSDGTYYTEKWIEIDPRDKYHHSCHIEHKSLESKLIVKLDPESNIALIAGIIAAILVVFIAVIAAVIWGINQKDDKRYTPANNNSESCTESDEGNTEKSSIKSEEGNSERSSTGSDEELLKKTEKQSK